METTAQREELIQYLTVADEDKIAALYTLLQHEILAPPAIPQEQLDMIFAARDSYQSDKESARPWEEVYERLKAKLRKNAA